MNDFHYLGLSDNILKSIDELKYTSATPIQSKMIPQILMGRDVIGLAATGSGKTAAFTLPILDILASGTSRFRMPRALILVPTRELASQIEENINLYGKYHQQKYLLLIGGVSMDAQIKALDSNIDIIIATPGRFLDHCRQGRILCNDIGILVLDEADRMLDMGFQQDLEAILDILPQNKQNIFLSATMPKNVSYLVRKYLNNPKEIQIDQENQASHDIIQYMIECDKTSKPYSLQELLNMPNIVSVLVFCNKKNEVNNIGKMLQKNGYSAGMLHGDMSQNLRLQWLEKFKQGDVNILVCSDVAARGLDIKSVSHVINVNVPLNPEDYIHRIGRTGRAGIKGYAITLVSNEETKYWQDVMKFQNKQLTPTILQDGKLISDAKSTQKLKTKKMAPKKAGIEQQSKYDKHKLNKSYREDISTGEENTPFGQRDDLPAFLK